MSSNLQTHFVVTYDHVEEVFYVDNNTAANYFDHDTWDDEAEQWVYLDEAKDVADDMASLQQKLQEALKFREIFDKWQEK